MLTLDSVLKIADDVVSRASDGELVVVLPQQGNFFVLNGTGAEIFQLVDGKRTLGEIAVALHARYEEIDLEQIQQDVLTFAEKIHKKAAVRLL
ncbi:MAG: PqqD family protein [Anaerolineae bacterium]